MAIRQIITVENENLHKQCKPVKEVDNYICRLLDDMMETMHHANGVGLAAPQVGVLRNVCVIDVDGQQFELINPEIIEVEYAAEDLLARAFCHEIDHLKGQVFLDIMEYEVEPEEA